MLKHNFERKNVRFISFQVHNILKSQRISWWEATANWVRSKCKQTIFFTCHLQIWLKINNFKETEYSSVAEFFCLFQVLSRSSRVGQTCHVESPPSTVCHFSPSPKPSLNYFCFRFAPMQSPLHSLV